MVTCAAGTKSLWMFALALVLSSILDLSMGARILIQGDKTSAPAWDEHQISRKLEVQVSMDNENLHIMQTIEFDGMEEGDEHLVFTRIKSASRNSVRGGKEVVWQGMLEGDGIGFATFVRPDGEGGQLSGTFTTGAASYSLITFADGTPHVKATSWSDFPDTDVEPEVPDSVRTAALDENEDLSGKVSVVPNNRGHFETEPWQQNPETKKKDPLRNRRVLRGGQAVNRSLQAINEVDVLVIVTNRAMCEYAGLQAGCSPTEENRAPMESALSIVQEQTNEAMTSVGIPVETRIVDIAFLLGTFDGRTSTGTLNVLLTDQNVNQWRRDAGADLVAMITRADPVVCGIAYLNTHVSATSYACFGSYTYTHELGHNFGANHDRNNVFSEQLHPYGHGYQYQSSTVAYRTLMAYQCPGGCPVVPFFSTDEYVFSDSQLPLGDANNDNARLMTENAPTVSNFLDTVVASPVAPLPTETVAPSPVSPPIDSIPEDSLSCPASSDCQGQNLLSFRFGTCLETCASEGSLYLRILVTLGYRCGGCS